MMEQSTGIPLHLHTMYVAYRNICVGQQPWVALGNFMNDFFGYYPHLRQELIQDPIQEPEQPTQEQHQWAVFCAASVEYLCEKYHLVCPDWVHDAAYTSLRTWWYMFPTAEPDVQESLLQETPEAFRRRNIVCGDNPYANKYEEAARFREMRLKLRQEQHDEVDDRYDQEQWPPRREVKAGIQQAMKQLETDLEYLKDK